MVHHKDHRRLAVHRRQRRLVEMPQPHAIERPAQPFREADRNAEIGRGGETRHDLARIAPGLFKGHVLGDALGLRMGGNRDAHLGIIDQPLDHVIAPRQLERLDGALQPRVQPRHRPLQPAPQKPPHRGKEKMTGKGDGRKPHQQHQRPERHLHGLSHDATKSGFWVFVNAPTHMPQRSELTAQPSCLYPASKRNKIAHPDSRGPVCRSRRKTSLG